MDHVISKLLMLSVLLEYINVCMCVDQDHKKNLIQSFKPNVLRFRDQKLTLKDVDSGCPESADHQCLGKSIGAGKRQCNVATLINIFV